MRAPPWLPVCGWSRTHRHKGGVMDFSEVRDRLLSIARQRLRNMPGAFPRFQYDLEHTINGASLIGSAQLSLPMACEMGERMGSRDASKWIQDYLTSVVDRWAQTEALTPVEPLPGARAQSPDLGGAACSASVLKRAAFIAKLADEWKTVKADLNDASANGLSKAAKVPGQHGMWFVEKAREWARQRGKLLDTDLASPANSVFALPVKKHRIKR
jgi:hypothetical protein